MIGAVPLLFCVEARISSSISAVFWAESIKNDLSLATSDLLFVSSSCISLYAET